MFTADVDFYVFFFFLPVPFEGLSDLVNMFEMNICPVKLCSVDLDLMNSDVLWGTWSALSQNRLLLWTVSSSGTWPQTVVGTRGGPPQETSPPCVPTGPNGFGTGSGNVPRTGGTWPAYTWACCPSSASWCPPCRKCFLPRLREEQHSVRSWRLSSSLCRQYWNSWKTGNMDSALSVWFLLLWLGGDSCNLVGSFLADQLPLQVTEDAAAGSSFCFHIHCNCPLWAAKEKSFKKGQSGFINSLKVLVSVGMFMRSSCLVIFTFLSRSHWSSGLVCSSGSDLHSSLLCSGWPPDDLHVHLLQAEEPKSRTWVLQWIIVFF